MNVAWVDTGRINFASGIDVVGGGPVTVNASGDIRFGKDVPGVGFSGINNLDVQGGTTMHFDPGTGKTITTTFEEFRKHPSVFFEIGRIE